MAAPALRANYPDRAGSGLDEADDETTKHDVVLEDSRCENRLHEPQEKECSGGCSTEIALHIADAKKRSLTHSAE